HYLEGMLTPDRMADLASATAQPASMNKDFNPILYYYHLRHWMSQFNVRFGLMQAGLLVVLGFYLVRLRGSALVLFASGFAASALEVVLLLAFQVLCGSVYHQVGVIVTVFMVGLAVGAMMANQSLNGRDALPRVPADRQVGPTRCKDSSGKCLTLLAFAIASYAVLLAL